MRTVTLLIITVVLVATPFIASAQVNPNPVVVIPGIAASWNWDVMLDENQTVDLDGWNFTPGVKQYDQLTQAFKDIGLVENEDFFIAHYDWRRSNEDSSRDYLVPVIDKALEHSQTGKVDIVAHSMGGLVARSYIQGMSYRNDVDQFILLGTPNFGSSDVYTLWEGGDVPDNWDKAQQRLLGLYLWYMTKITNQTDDAYDTIHQFVPSVKELLPAYTYLVNKDTGEYTDYWTMQEVNDYLEELNSGVALFILSDRVPGGITVYAGNGKATVGEIPIVPHSDADGKLWIDGKPDPETPERNNAEGDNRVLLSSAHLPDEPPIPTKADPWWKTWLSFIPSVYAQSLFYQFEELPSLHGDLPTRAIEKIFTTLGLTAPPNDYEPIAEAQEELSFWFASPVEVSVTDPQNRTITRTSNDIPGAFYDGETDPMGVKIITVENPLAGEYTVELKGLADGSYHFATAHFKQDAPSTETTVEKTIALGEEVGYTVAFTPNAPSVITISDPFVPGEEEPETPLTLINKLITQVETLQTDDTVSKKLGSVLLLPLKLARSLIEQAEALLASDHPKSERNAKILKQFAVLNLNVFIGIVNRNTNTLDAILATDLKTQAQDIITLLQSP
jgi:pimeloyl-ACP methyl ester carboxylesterase